MLYKPVNWRFWQNVRARAGVDCCHVRALSWVCVVIADSTCVPRLLPCTTGVQPHPAPESNQTDSGQVRLLKLAINHTLHIPPTQNEGLSPPTPNWTLNRVLCCPSPSSAGHQQWPSLLLGKGMVLGGGCLSTHLGSPVCLPMSWVYSLQSTGKKGMKSYWGLSVGRLFKLKNKHFLQTKLTLEDIWQ